MHHRSLGSISAIAVLALALGCGGKSTPRVHVEPPELSPEEASAVVRLARLELDNGEELARRGLWTEARVAFDNAVDLLLALPGGVSSSPEAQALYEDVLATIHESERTAREAGRADGAALEQSESASVDGLAMDVLESLEPEVEDEEELASEDLPEVTYDIPIELNGRVRSIIEMYQERRHDWYQAALERMARYEPMVREIFAEEGVPQDLIFLAMVESAFKPRAVSRAGARGIWQFIRGTGRLYGLEQDFWVDDRFNPEKATRAAARHLKDLYEVFGDWYLVMAAYNSGQRRVERAIRRTGSRDFWTHARRRVLPRETRSYVPLILAAIVIGKNPEAYGFEKPPAEPIEYDVVRLDHPVDLETAAEAAGVGVDDLKALNPELRRWVTPMESDDYPLRIPKGKVEVFRTALADIPEAERVRFGTHVVRRGDTLSQIASRYGTSIAALTAANQISRRSLIHPGQVLTVPVPPGASGRVLKSVSERESRTAGGREVYVVQRGDTLGEIATAFRLSLGELRELNGMGARASRIHPGQELVVSPGRAVAANPAPSSSRRPAADASTVYVVQPGDTLGEIAEAHGLGLSVLRRLNGFSGRRTRIYPGQTLTVREGAERETVASAGPTRYRVRRGDTLSRIARRFGVSVEDIRAWNGMSSDRIVAGERLTIHPKGGDN